MLKYLANGIQSETYSSLETALHFALKGEERLNRLCTEKYDSTKTQDCQTEDVDALLEAWRKQKKICERLAKCLVSLDFEYTNPCFSPATLDGKGIHTLKTYIERQHEGTLLYPVSKS